MGQQEVIEILEISNVPLAACEIAKLLNVEEFKVSKTLKCLIKFNEVKVFELPKNVAMKFYKCKRRLRLFYV